MSRQTARTWIFVATVMALAVVTMTAGCVRTEVADLAPEESKAELISLLDAIEQEVGGEWENEMSQPQECSVTGIIGSGVQWTFLRLAQRTGDMESARRDTEKVAQLLEDSGYDVRPATFAEDLGYDFGSNNGAGSEVDFGANHRSMSLIAGGSCVAGNLNDFDE